MNWTISTSDSGRLFIGVIGAGNCDAETAEIALQVGREIAGHGAILVCGGLGGVMRAAAQGAHSVGGLSIGILPGESHDDANEFITIPIPTGLGHARNVLVVRASHGLIAVSGGYGTLSEIALARKMNKPVVGLNTWDLPGDWIKETSPVRAVERVISEIGSKRQ